jgi:hypothetical protein
MAPKEKKTAPELAALIMREIRELPEYDHITRVTITRVPQLKRGLFHDGSCAPTARSLGWQVCPGVPGIHTRDAGGRVFVEFHIEFPGEVV